MPVTFSLIGGAGFRAQYYLRIAQALPDRFQIGGLVVRDETKALAMERQWGVRTYRSVEALLQQEQQDFIVLSVSGSEMLPYLLQLAETGIPVLSETRRRRHRRAGAAVCAAWREKRKAPDRGAISSASDTASPAQIDRIGAVGADHRGNRIDFPFVPRCQPDSPAAGSRLRRSADSRNAV